jgi:hypothetical protein
MAKFGKNNQPPNEHKRLPKFRTRMIDALKARGVDEQGFVALLVSKALDGEGNNGVYISELLKRYAPITKATLEPVDIANFPQEGTPLQKAEAVYNAMAAGEIPPDVGQIFIDSISKLLAIEEITELKARLDKLEAIVNKN